MARFVAPACAFAGCLLGAHAWSVPPVLAVDLARACAADSGAEAMPERCAIYIAGFLDGALATDARVAENVSKEFERSSTLTERAIQTRVGARIKGLGASVYAEYCIGEPVPIEDVIALVRRRFEETPPGPGDRARDAVYTALRASYPCRG